MIRAGPAVLAALAALGCEGPFRPTPRVATVRVTPDSLNIAIGQSAQLSAAVEDSAGHVVSRTVTWTSLNPSVATVTGSGVVTGVDGGSTTVTASVDAVADTASVVVHIPVAAVTIDLGDQEIVTGATLRFSATARDATGRPLLGHTIDWSIGDTSVATLATDGADALLTGRLPGSTDLTAAVGAHDTTVTLTVSAVRFTGIWAAESDHSCGVTDTGAAYCWGDDALGELGNGIAPASAAPSRVTGSLDLALLSPGGRFTCALTHAGNPYCWGSGANGRLGNGSLDDSAVPVAVAGAELTELSSGWGLTCGPTASGAMYCWGHGGGLGADTLKFSDTPVPIGGEAALHAVGAGNQYGCALATDSTAYCWGTNLNGRLGTTAIDYTDVPVPVSGGLRFDTLVVGPLHACALSAGTAYCWGGNATGQLGNGTTTGGATPGPVAGGLVFSALSAGNEHTCGLTTDGSAWCWGANPDGRLGAPPGATLCQSMPCATSPVAVSGGWQFTTIAAGGAHTCAIATGGLAYCWGGNGAGQLGDGTMTAQSAPVPVLGQTAPPSLSRRALEHDPRQIRHQSVRVRLIR